MFEIVKHTKFSLDANGDGGCKRSLQIHELLEQCGLNITNESLDLPKNLSLSNKISLFLKGFSLTKKSFPIKGLHSIRKIIETSKYMGLRQSVLEKYKNNIVMHQRMSDALESAMGNEFFIAKFESFNEMMEFKEMILSKK